MQIHDSFKNYYLKSLELVKKFSQSSLQEPLLTLIDEQSAKELNDDLKLFFKGEKAFYQANYTEALNYYLQSRSVPYYKLFCYRASAYAAFETGDIKRALQFGNKALNEYREDIPSQNLLSLIALQKEVDQRKLEVQQSLDIGLPLVEEKHPEPVRPEEGEKRMQPTPIHVEPVIGTTPITPVESVSPVDDEKHKEHGPLYQFSTLLAEAANTQSIDNTRKGEIIAKTLDLEAEGNNSSVERTTQVFTEEVASVENLNEESSLTTSVQTSLTDEETTESPKQLIKRLYHQSKNEPKHFSVSLKSLQEMAQEEPLEIAPTPLFHPKNPLPPLEENFLENQLRKNRHHRKKELADYLKLLERMPAYNNLLYILEEPLNTSTPIDRFFNNYNPSSSSYFIRWQGKGIAINPGKNFLSLLHKRNIHLKQVDFVIQTQDNSECEKEIEKIDYLNTLLQEECGETHPIQYWLCRRSYQSIGHNLKATKERVHSLELFLSSPLKEREKLTPSIELEWFSLAEKAYLNDHLGLSLKLTAKDRVVTIGLLEKRSWNPDYSQLFIGCSLIFAGVGALGIQDKFSTKGLQLEGIKKLIEDVKPECVVCSDFVSAQRELRLPICRWLREETKTTVLPLDANLTFQLSPLKVLCMATKEYLTPDQITVVGTNGQSKLSFLSPVSVL